MVPRGASDIGRIGSLGQSGNCCKPVIAIDGHRVTGNAETLHTYLSYEHALGDGYALSIVTVCR